MTCQVFKNTAGLFFCIQMDQILHPLGRIIRKHGYNGTVVLVSNQPLDDDTEHLKEVFVVIDGLQVPFPVEEFVLLTDTSAHVQLEFVSNESEANELIGCEVYAAVDPYKQESKEESESEQWIGFAVHDVRYGKIGIIREIEDYKGNRVMQIMEGDRETLISLYPELVTNIDHDTKTLHITAPDGYF